MPSHNNNYYYHAITIANRTLRYLPPTHFPSLSPRASLWPPPSFSSSVALCLFLSLSYEHCYYYDDDCFSQSRTNANLESIVHHFPTIPSCECVTTGEGSGRCAALHPPYLRRANPMHLALIEFHPISSRGEPWAPSESVIFV